MCFIALYTFSLWALRISLFCFTYFAFYLHPFFIYVFFFVCLFIHFICDPWLCCLLLTTLLPWQFALLSPNLHCDSKNENIIFQFYTTLKRGQVSRNLYVDVVKLFFEEFLILWFLSYITVWSSQLNFYHHPPLFIIRLEDRALKHLFICIY